MNHFPRRSQPEVRGALLRGAFAILALLLGVSNVADAEFVLADQESDVYQRFVLVAGGDIKVAKDGEAVGNLHSNAKVDLKKGALVDGDVSAVDKIKNKGTVTGTVTNNADPVVLPELLTEEEMRALADRVFEGNTEFTDEIIDDIVFVAGQATIEGDLNGVGTLLVTGDIRFDSDSDSGDSDSGDSDSGDSDSGDSDSGNKGSGSDSGDSDSGDSDSEDSDTDVPPATFFLADTTRLSLISRSDVHLDQDRPFRGVIRAGGDLELEQGAVIEGVLAADGKIDIKKNARITFLVLDLESPMVTLVTPEDGTVLDGSPESIVAAWSDGVSGVDPSTASILLDGIDRTAEAVATDAGLTLALTEVLVDGAHTVEIAVSDQAGNVGAGSFGFEVLTVPVGDPPTLAIISPRPIILDERRPDILIAYQAEDASIDPDSLRIRLDGTDLTAGCSATPTSATCALTADLAPGPHLVDVEVRSTLGAVATASVDFEIVVGEGPHTLALESGAADTSLDPDAPVVAFGEAEALRLGDGSGSRVLVRFPEEALLPLGAGELISAVLRFQVAANGGGWGAGRPVDVHHALLVPWIESAATWSCPDGASCDLTWDGGMYDLSATSSTTIDDAATGELTFDVLADVQSFLRTGETFGWVLKKRDEAAPGTIELSAREAGSGPQLVLSFANPPPAEPTTDGVAPTLEFTAPRVPILLDETSTILVVTFDDDGSGVDATSLNVALDGLDITSDCLLEASFATCPAVLGVASTDSTTRHLAVAELSDVAGNRGRAELELLLIQGEGDVTDPAITITAPAAGTVVSSSVVTISGTVEDDGIVGVFLVDDEPVEVDDGAFSTTVQLDEGENIITVLAIDGTGKQVETSITVFRDTELPLMEVEVPADGLLTTAENLVVQGTVEDGGGLDRVTVNGLTATVIDGVFEAPVALAEGLNTVTVIALDRGGNQVQVVREVARRVLPEVMIESPGELDLVNASEIAVTGSVSTGVIAVEVNGLVASLASGQFTVPAVPLTDGINQLEAMAHDVDGLVATTVVSVIRDTQAPRLSVQSPAEGAVIYGTPISVRGLVHDLEILGVGASLPQVTVNGQAARVDGRSYILEELALSPGANVLTVEAADQAGNVAQQSVTVDLATATAARLVKVSGDHQQASIGASLPAALVVRADDFTGQPSPGVTVVFEVVATNGHFADGRRQIAVMTDAAGEARVDWTLGTRAGAGNQIVQATAAGFLGPITWAASALPSSPARVHTDAGDGQLGVLGVPLPESLVAVVTDEGFNRLAGVPVVFEAVEGGGTFTNGLSQMTVLTDPDGRAAVRLTVGPNAGVANNVVEATVPGLADEYAAFLASGYPSGDPAATAVSGTVLDNTDQPVPGATVSLAGTSLVTTTDPQGRFRLTGVLPGLAHLEVDARTTTREGVWPHLEFMVHAIAGRENDMGRPIYVLPLSPENGIAVSETQGGEITLPDLPGFALEIAPGSVTFPDGSREGVVSVTPVNSEKVPMAPNFGQQPQFIVTIQPAGARFDPPARMSLPNVDGLAPGAVTEMYSFDHDLFRFVSIGPAQVTEDGTRVVSLPGVGVIEAGWHCGGDPAGAGTTHDCPICRDCVRDRCVPDNSQTPPQAAPDDCRRQICRNGSVDTVPDYNETPPQTEGNCRREICARPPVGGWGGGFVPPQFVIDLSDHPPGQQCCQYTPPLSDRPFTDPFNPATECCENSGVLPLHPVQNLNQCPRLRPYVNHVPMANGCGPEGGSIPVPQDPAPGCQPFTPACNGHDLCWDDCQNSAGHKLGCDAAFLQNLRQICSGCSNLVARNLCEKLASAYAAAVGVGGWGAYYAAQRQACQCC